MWLMLQQDAPGDYVIGTGESHSVREFVEPAFAHAGLDWREYVRIDPRYYRPAEVDDLRADASKARRLLRLDAEGGLPGTGRDDGGRRHAELRRKLNGGRRPSASRWRCDLSGIAARSDSMLGPCRRSASW